MKTLVTLDIRRTFLALSGIVVVMLVTLAGISIMLSWDSQSRLAPLNEQAKVLASAQDDLLDLLTIQQKRLDLRTDAQFELTESELKRRDNLLTGLDSLQKQVAANLEITGSAQRDYEKMTGVTGVGVVFLILALVILTVVARQRILNPLSKLSALLGRLAHEDYTPEPVDGLDAMIRPAFESYNRLVIRLGRLQKAHRARHSRLENQVHEATRMLVAQRAELARTERLAAVGEVAAALAHEVRNPLAAIRAACRSLIEDTNDADHRERLQMVDEEVERVVNLVNKQLRPSRHRPEKAEPTDVTWLIRQLVRLMKYQMPVSIRLRLEIPSKVVAVLPPNGLRQSLLNLLKNSQEALGDGGGTITVKLQEYTDAVEIAVEDNGSGFPDTILTSGIHPFTTTKEGGTGLGLAIADRYARENGSRLEIRNLPEGGSRVRIRLPRELESSATSATHTARLG